MADTNLTETQLVAKVARLAAELARAKHAGKRRELAADLSLTESLLADVRAESAARASVTVATNPELARALAPHLAAGRLPTYGGPEPLTDYEREYENE